MTWLDHSLPIEEDLEAFSRSLSRTFSPVGYDSEFHPFTGVAPEELDFALVDHIANTDMDSNSSPIDGLFASCTSSDSGLFPLIAGFLVLMIHKDDFDLGSHRARKHKLDDEDFDYDADEDIEVDIPAKRAKGRATKQAPTAITKPATTAAATAAQLKSRKSTDDMTLKKIAALRAQFPSDTPENRRRIHNGLILSLLMPHIQMLIPRLSARAQTSRRAEGLLQRSPREHSRHGPDRAIGHWSDPCQGCRVHRATKARGAGLLGRNPGWSNVLSCTS